MSELDKIKARLEAARGLEWHSYRLARYEDGRTDYAVAPSPLERTHFSEGEAEFVVCSREDMAKLLAVVEAELGQATPAGLASAYRDYTKKRTTADWEKERAIKRAEAWEGLAEKLEAIEAE